MIINPLLRKCPLKPYHFIETVETVDLSDGTITSTNYYNYDSNGNLEYSEIDWDNDGTIYSTTYYHFDSNGNIEMIEGDRDNDGTIDFIRYYSWD